MEIIMDIANRHNIFVVEDAAQAIDSYYKGKPLGSIGHLAAFSFHETKNIISGEGGLLAINDDRFVARSEIIWEKGTNRSAFWRGEVDKYGWVDIGSSFLPSDLTAAFLLAQLEELDNIQSRRKKIWDNYYHAFKGLAKENFRLPDIPAYATNNAHMFFIVCSSVESRNHLIKFLKSEKINSVFHYMSLHMSPFYAQKHDGRELVRCDHYSNCLVRLPFYYGLNDSVQDYIIESVTKFFS
jgi:dTDP-4-amino-4,6-dideoxygalactose transaminase